MSSNVAKTIKPNAPLPNLDIIDTIVANWFVPQLRSWSIHYGITRDMTIIYSWMFYIGSFYHIFQGHAGRFVIYYMIGYILSVTSDTLVLPTETRECDIQYFGIGTNNLMNRQAHSNVMHLQSYISPEQYVFYTRISYFCLYCLALWHTYNWVLTFSLIVINITLYEADSAPIKQYSDKLLYRLDSIYLSYFPNGVLVHYIRTFVDQMHYKRGFFNVNNAIIILSSYKGLVIATIIAVIVKLSVVFHIIGIDRIEEVTSAFLYNNDD